MRLADGEVGGDGDNGGESDNSVESVLKFANISSKFKQTVRISGNREIRSSTLVAGYTKLSVLRLVE